MEDFGILKTQNKIMNQHKIQLKEIQLKDWRFIVCVSALVLTAACSSHATETNNISNVPVTETNSPEHVWNTMKSCLATNNIQGAVSCFSVASRDDYQQAFSSLSKTNMVTYVEGLGSLKKISMENDKAEFYFTNTVAGNIIAFPVEFNKENGVWKIMEF